MNHGHVPPLRGLIRDIPAADEHSALFWMEKARSHPKRRCLATAACPQKGNGLPLANIKIQPIQHKVSAYSRRYPG